MAQMLALWDFDGTIAKGDSVFPWVRLMIKKGEMKPADLVRMAAAFLRWRLGRSDILAFKETSTAFLRGKSEEEADTLGEALWREVLSKRLYTDSVTEIRRQKEAGIQVIIVSASTDCYMRTVARELGADALLCTRCETDEAGRYTGRLTGKNCRCEEKPRRIAAYLAEHGMNDSEIISAWGDSFGDLPMLSMAKTAHAINPRRRMRKNLPAGAIIERYSV